jgi:rhodanese-related sulfurtransferase
MMRGKHYLSCRVLGWLLLPAAFLALPLVAEEQARIKPKKQICVEAMAAVPHITAADLQGKIVAGDTFVLLDIRTRAEYETGHIAGAVWLPRGFLEFKVEDLAPDPETEIVVYCLKSCRGSAAARTLLEMGYRNVKDLEGGLGRWIKGGLPLRNQYGEFTVTDYVDKDPYVPIRD